MKRIFSLGLVLCLLLSAGCATQTAKDSWKFTKRQYRTYLNTPAELDKDEMGSCENYEIALGEAVITIDDQLQRFVRSMENSDRSPDQAWVTQMMQKYPWLSGVALINKDGGVIARYPEYSAKELDVKPLLEVDPKQRISALRGYVQESSQGPEVYVGNPVYMGEELRGMVVAFFDPKTLLSLSQDPGSITLASPSGILWPGNHGAGINMDGQTWAKLLQNKSCGLLGSGSGAFYWTTRYLGNLPIVYAMPVSLAKGSYDIKEKEAGKKSDRTSSGAAGAAPVASAPMEQ